MSVHHYFYAEVKTGDKWIGLVPFVKMHDGKFKMQPLLWGQSSMYDFYEELIDNAGVSCGLPEDISAELLEVFHNPNEKTTSLFGKEITWREYYRDKVHSVKYNTAITSKIKRDRPYKYQGYVDKRTIAAFEVGEIDEIGSWLTSEEYEKRSAKGKKQYAWFEWNVWWEEYGLRYDIFQKVESLLEWYRESSFLKGSGYSYHDFCGSNVRLIIYRS